MARNVASGDLIDRYLPHDFAIRLPAEGRHWRGRTILLMWGLGYPLAMAWSFGLADDPEMTAFCEAAIKELSDERLIELLDSTVDARGDGSEFWFGSF